MSSDRGRLDRRRQKSRHRRRRRITLLVLLAMLAPITYSYVTTMVRSSSLPLSVRTVEWIRANHGAWAVNTVERYWYTWHAPKKGGPALKTLPVVGRPVKGAPATPTRKHHRLVAFRPARLRPLIRPVLPGEGVWHRIARDAAGRPPVLVTTFRSEPAYPRIVAYVAWIDHKGTQLALYPGRYEPPHASPRGPIEVPLGQRGRLLATFNSGFTYKDGHGGFAVNGSTATPLRGGVGTVVAYRNGRVDVIAWRGEERPRQGGRPRPPEPAPAREPRAAESDHRRRKRVGRHARQRRSSLALRSRCRPARQPDLCRRRLPDCEDACRLLIHAGAVRAIELDINAEWPSFITYGPVGAPPIKLVPNYQQPPQPVPRFRRPRLLRGLPTGPGRPLQGALPVERRPGKRPASSRTGTGETAAALVPRRFASASG